MMALLHCRSLSFYSEDPSGPPSQRKNRGTSVSQNHGFFTIYSSWCFTKVWLFSLLAADEPAWCVVRLETASFAPWFESVG